MPNITFGDVSNAKDLSGFVSDVTGDLTDDVTGDNSDLSGVSDLTVVQQGKDL